MNGQNVGMALYSLHAMDGQHPEVHSENHLIPISIPTFVSRLTHPLTSSHTLSHPHPSSHILTPLTHPLTTHHSHTILHHLIPPLPPLTLFLSPPSHSSSLSTLSCSLYTPLTLYTPPLSLPHSLPLLYRVFHSSDGAALVCLRSGPGQVTPLHTTHIYTPTKLALVRLRSGPGQVTPLHTDTYIYPC